MNRRTLTGVAVAVLGVLAIALAAATLPSAVDRDPGVGGDGGGGGDESEPGFGTPPADDRPVDAVEIPYLVELLTVVLAIVALILLVYLLRNWRETIPGLVATAVLTAFVVVALWFVADAIPLGGAQPPESVGGGGFGGGDGDNGVGSGDAVPVSPVLIAILTIAALGVLLVAARSSTGDPDAVEPSADGDADADERDRVAIGRAAGRAADRIEAGDDVENDVVRAWREMVSLLDVSEPETTTPREFATAAVDAGMNRDDVDELTRLFEDVRYGEYSPTPEREQRAIRVFRRIEREYGGEEP